MAATAGVGLLWLIMLGAGGGVGVPLGVPPLPEDPLLAKVAPGECLFYFSSAGMAKPDAHSGNQTEQLFAEPEIQHLVTEGEKFIRAQLKEAAAKERPEARAFAENGPTLVKVLLTRPLAVYVAEAKVVPKEPPKVRAGAIVSLGEDADQVKDALEHLVAAAKVKAKDVTIDGTTFRQLTFQPDGSDLTWGVKENYLYVATGDGEIEALLKRAKDSAPKWLTALHKELHVERVSTVGMINVHALADLLAPLGGPEVPKVLEALGVTGIDRLSGVSGLDKERFVSRSLVSFRGEPRGLLQLADQKPLTTADVDLMPANATFALAWKLDPEKARTTIIGTIEKIDPKWKEPLNESQRELLDEVLKALGDSWCLFDSPSGGGMFTGATAVVSLKDAEAAADVQKKLLALVESAGKRVRDARRRPHVQTFTFAGKTVHVFDPGEKNFPLAPSWCLTDKHLVVGLFPEAVKAFLARDKNFQPLTKAPGVSAALAGEGQAIALTYADTRRVFDLVYPFAPVAFQMAANAMRQEGIDVPAGLMPTAGSIRRHLRPSVSVVWRTPAGIETVSRQTLPGNMGFSTLPVAAGLLLPAVQKVREAASRTASQNNLKQIGIGIYDYQFQHRSFPPAYQASKDGKPLLSWRVLILPFIEQSNLYNEFHLDEPWDSEHNKKLIEQMPKLYRSPTSSAAPGRTNYLTVRGKDTAFPGQEGVKLSEITDGTANTIMLVEVSDRKAVIWTKPDDFEFNEKNPIDGLLGLWPDGFLVTLCDGSVRMIRRNIDPAVLKNLFIRNDGNPLPPDY
jgi:hypothetical protein